MKQEKHIDIEAMLHDLPQEANKAMGGLEATPFLKARINRAVNAQKQEKAPITLPKWAPALCCAALVLVLVAVFVPMNGAQPGVLINSAPLGSPTPVPTHARTADLNGGTVFISNSSSKPGYRNIWSDVKGGSFPLIGINGKYYRMLTNPAALDRSLLGVQVATISEYTTEPSLSGTDAVLSNAATAGTAVYSLQGVSADTLVAAEVNGRLRLFQRVSFNGNALRGREKLQNTLDISGRVIGMELSGVGTVTDPSACEALLSILLDCASYESSGSISSKQSLLIELDNGLVLQLAVKGDNLAACGVWSCPEFFESFADYRD
ncbi:MAG: hypothetical protein IKL25_01310 [Clostridia bacterium]|nr:hypothetical protein [Clostridia bacterium]